MSRFIDRYESHPIHNSINTIENNLNDFLQRENLQPNVLEELEQARHVLEYFKVILDNCEPTLIPPAVLNTLNDHMARPIIGELANYQSK